MYLIGLKFYEETKVRMFTTLSETEAYYKSGPDDKHKVLYETFTQNITEKNSTVATAFEQGEGFGELAFCWQWNLLVDAMKPGFKFLEIGVYKGRTLGIVQMLANQSEKACDIFGLTPLTNAGDKYSTYTNEPYGPAITANLVKMGLKEPINIQLIEGLSTDPPTITTAQKEGPYDIIYIDGGHDYEIVCHDIATFVPLLKPGGYLVMDDASLHLENPYGRFLGHPDVCNAIKEKIDGRSELTHIFAVGHNRVWRKNA